MDDQNQLKASSSFRILWPLFVSNWFKIACILTLVYFLVGILISALALYERKLMSSLAVHQADIQIRSISDQVDETSMQSLKQEVRAILGTEVALSVFLEGTSFQFWKAGAIYPGQTEPSSFGNQSMIQTSIIGMEKNVPGILNVNLSGSYASGQFRFRLTPLEQSYYWYNVDETVMPNKAMDESFYPPISQSVMLATEKDGTFHQYLVNQPYIDFRSDSVLYMSLSRAQDFFYKGEPLASGLLVDLPDANQVRQTIELLERQLTKELLAGIRISSWLDHAHKQRELLQLLTLIVFCLSVIIASLGILLVFLSQYRAVVAKHNALSILIKLGLVPNSGLWIGLTVSAIVAFVLSGLLIWNLLPAMSPLFGFDINLQDIYVSVMPWLVTILVIFMVASERTIYLALKQNLNT